MYKDVVKIYVGDLENSQGKDFWEEVQKRLEYANSKYNTVDDFYLTIIKDEMKEFSEFTTYDNGYIVYTEESTDNISTEPILIFTKDDLVDSNLINNNAINHNYIER